MSIPEFFCWSPNSLVDEISAFVKETPEVRSQQEGTMLWGPCTTHQITLDLGLSRLQNCENKVLLLINCPVCRFCFSSLNKWTQVVFWGLKCPHKWIEYALVSHVLSSLHSHTGSSSFLCFTSLLLVNSLILPDFPFLSFESFYQFIITHIKRWFTLIYPSLIWSTWRNFL